MAVEHVICDVVLSVLTSKTNPLWHVYVTVAPRRRLVVWSASAFITVGAAGQPTAEENEKVQMFS